MTTPDQARQQLLDVYDVAEDILTALIADPGPAVDGGEILRDANGQPIPNPDVIREAGYTLAYIRDRRALILGQDLGNPN